MKKAKHRYGPKVNIFQDPTAMGWLANLCSPTNTQPAFSVLLGFLYMRLVPFVLAEQYPLQKVKTATRMTATSGVQWAGKVIKAIQTVVVDIARGGSDPSKICFDILNWSIDASFVRRDLVVASRVTGANHQVTGTDIHGGKVDGSVEGAYLLIPDPMGATGGSLETAIRMYIAEHGRPAKIITMNMIITPEFIHRIMALGEELGIEIVIYAYRLDRGMSHPKALRAMPGTYPIPSMAAPDQPFESGLDEHQYIVPGGGDFGKIGWGTTRI